MTERAFDHGRGLLEGGDAYLTRRWRALPIWQQWALMHVDHGVTVTTYMRNDEPDLTRARKFCINAKRRPGGDTWTCEIAVHHLEDTHDVDYVVLMALRDMRPDFILPEPERDANALRRLRMMASGIVPNETPAPAMYAWVLPVGMES